MKSKNTGGNFYDDFVKYQIESGINDRIYHLFQQVKTVGLKPNSKVLEIGCGIGSLTYLLNKKVRHGKYEAVDISPKSIEYAKKHLLKLNLSLTAGNILDYDPTNQPFDFILMFDVLEHIPSENYESLFSKISAWMNEQSMLLINIPNLNYILYDQEHQPEVLQEIDQPVFIDQLTLVFKTVLLELIHFETYSVWVKDDYHFLMVRKNSPFKEVKVSDTRNIFDKIINRLGREWRKYRYNYPI